MHRTIVLAAIALFWTFPTSLFALDLTELDRYIKSQMQKSGIPGVAVAVTQGNSIIWAKGYGVRSVDTGEAVNEETLFHIASTHKSITALLSAILVDQGILRWDTRVDQIISADSIDDSAIAGIRFSQLLSMTGGFVEEDEDFFYDDYGDTPTPQQLLGFVQNLRLAVLPGREFNYSNLSVAFAGYLAVIASGGSTADLNQSYAELLQRYVLDPIGMTHSTIFVSQARNSDNFAVSHVRGSRGSSVVATEDVDNDALAPAGSLKSNVVDMARYLITVANRGVDAEGERIVSFGSLRTTWKATKISGKDKYALGWDVKRISTRNVLIHEGAFDNYVSVIMVDKAAKVSLVILANTESVGALLTKGPEVLLNAVRKSKMTRSKRR